MMQRIVETTEAPRTPLLSRLVETMLADEPPDMSLFAALMTPEMIEARGKADAEQKANDWPNLGRYEAANAALIAAGSRPDVVFMGDSITEAWPAAHPDFFACGHVGRGISGQTSPQMLVRFYGDVLALKPKAVHLLCGTNDVAGNTGPTTPERYQNAVRAMTELAAGHGIGVLLGSIPPAAKMNWRPGLDPRLWVNELNAWLKALCADKGFTYVDYHAALRDADEGLPPNLSHDGVHPTRRGYDVMRKVLEPLL